jgi:exopolysaccharide biosynthesis protein
MSRARTAAGMAIVLGSLTMLIAFTVPSDVGLAAGRKPKPPVVTTVRKLAPGVKLTKIVNRRIPRRTFILAIDPSKGATLRFILSNDLIPDLERTSSMARRSEALAAVNGDLGSISTGRPTHPMAIDGELIQTSLDQSGSFAISDDGSMRIGRPETAVSVTQMETGEVFPIESWNGFRPHVGDLDGYTAVGGISFGPPKDACWARLSPATEADPGPEGVVRDYSVAETSCTPAPPSAREDVILASLPGTDEAAFIRSLSAGETIRLGWSFGWPAIVDAMGGGPILLQGGEIVLGPCTTSICNVNPRTAVGLTSDGTVLLVVIDGRQKTSVGMTLGQLAEYMRKLGSVQAMNLDGGGSSTLVVRGDVVNRPSDGHERRVAAAIAVMAPP